MTKYVKTTFSKVNYRYMNINFIGPNHQNVEKNAFYLCIWHKTNPFKHVSFFVVALTICSFRKSKYRSRLNIFYVHLKFKTPYFFCNNIETIIGNWAMKMAIFLCNLIWHHQNYTGSDSNQMKNLYQLNILQILRN